MKSFISILICITPLWSFSMEIPSKFNAKYNETIEFKLKQKLEFPDFTLVYLGEQVHGHLPGNPNIQSVSSNFTVIKDGKEIEHISQSIGFGALADDMSSHFKIGDKIFELNFGSAFVNFKTVKMNQLKDNQLIIFSFSLDEFRRALQQVDEDQNEKNN